MVNFDKKTAEADALTTINQDEVVKFLQEKLTGDIVEDLKQIYEHYRRDSSQVSFTNNSF